MSRVIRVHATRQQAYVRVLCRQPICSYTNLLAVLSRARPAMNGVAPRARLCALAAVRTFVTRLLASASPYQPRSGPVSNRSEYAAEAEVRCLLERFECGNR